MKWAQCSRLIDVVYAVLAAVLVLVLAMELTFWGWRTKELTYAAR